jgi:ATP-binding cassette subfamily B protein
LNHRISALRATYRDRLHFLSLLRHVSAGILGAFIIANLLHVLLPAAAAVGTGWLLAMLSRPDESYVLPLVVLGIIFLVAQVSNVASRWTRVQVTSRIDIAHRSAVARLATGTATVDALEDQEVQDLLKTAAADPKEWVEKTPGQGATASLRILLNYAGLLSSAIVVAAWSLWIIPALLIPALIVRHLSLRLWNRHFRIWVDGIEHHRRYHYWGELTTKPAEGKELRVFGLADWVLGRYQTHMRAHLDPVWRDNYALVLAQWKQFLIAFVPLAAVFCSVGFAAAGDPGSVGVASAVLAAGWGVFSAVSGSLEVMEIAGARPGLQALDELRRRLTSGAVPPADPEVRSEAPLVKFEQASFGYGSHKEVIKGLDLEIHSGEKLAIVGFNGAGKSTLIKLLAGVYRPTSGRITADGKDTAALPHWNSHLSVIYQDFVKYHLTVAENVALGYPGAPDQAAIAKAVADAGFDEVVDKLEAGLDTSLDRSRSGGADLSGGQWQQLALARALYAINCGARILVLDEPTAHLDVRTEQALFERLDNVTGPITTILVSHRLATVRRADRIVLLDNGRITEDGSHEELMTVDGVYAAMYRLQAQRYESGFDDRLEEGELR